ncbi:MAG: hypothetical protein LBS28_04130 [Streptococcaceae bacterium]|jgi:hypothetical protein|nr:hypothetical protein [Streptococcaceae bacterium]
MKNKARKFIKNFLLLIAILPVFLNFTQVVFAEEDDETTEQSDTPAFNQGKVGEGNTNGNSSQTSTAITAALSNLGYIMQLQLLELFG